MCNLKELKGAISLIAKFDTLEDDNQIDNLICHAIKIGIDIDIEEDSFQESYLLEAF